MATTNEASYRVRVSNSEGSALSDAAFLTVLATNRPVIVQDPSSRTVFVGSSARFMVTGSGSLHLSYQWLYNELPIANETNTTLSLFAITTGQAGNYRAVLANEAGSVTSAVAVLTVLTAANGSSAAALLADSPNGYWRLNEANGPIAYDSWGLNYGGYSNAVIYGVAGALTNDSDTAVRFDGVNAKTDVPFAASLNASNFTFECWARVTNGAGTYRSPLTSRDDNPQRGYIFYASAGNTWEFWSGKGDMTGWHSIIGPAVTLNQWVHLVGTYDSATQTKRFYVNSVLIAEVVVAYAPNTSRPLRIGGGKTDDVLGTYFFPGDVDEVVVYGTALSSNRVRAHYLAGLQQADVSGQVALEAFVGASRAVTFAATDGATFTNRLTQTLPFTGGLASYSLTVPAATTRLSAKTAWNLRRSLSPVIANSQATVNFTSANTLPGGDLDGSNQVEFGDYFALAAWWYQSVPAADIDGNGRVDLDDYFLMANHWLESGSEE